MLCGSCAIVGELGSSKCNNYIRVADLKPQAVNGVIPIPPVSCVCGYCVV